MTQPVSLRVLLCPDKFRGTLTAPQAAAAMAAGVSRARAATGSRAGGVSCRMLPLADGGEGSLDAFGGPNRWSTVRGPLGAPTRAGWRIDGESAVIECAAAAGLLLAGGAERNDPVAASTVGVGELILASVDAGAREILVCVGGSATTDGGAGALSVLAPEGGPSLLPKGSRITVAADVRTRFLDAATVFGPQKGASEAEVALLTGRLVELRRRYRELYGIDVQRSPGSGAAGGLAGGLTAIGAEIVAGDEVLADAVGLDAALAESDLVITGEGRLDSTSLAGKTVGGVIRRAGARGKPVLVVAGAIDEVDLPSSVRTVSLSGHCGPGRALGDAEGCVIDTVAAVFETWASEAAG